MAIDVRSEDVRDRVRRAASGRSGERQAQPKPLVSGAFTLEGLLLCRGCGTSLQPVRMLGQRAYRGPCGCRLTAVDAEDIEQLVLEAVAVPGLVADAAPEELGGIFRRLFVAVRVGGCAQDLSIVWRLQQPIQ
ncbi:zinc ribbon domain-containing protein [Micromonospora endolithica]|uniref:Recombinase zinc beta ribbon domain-containing protein n=1 Tax=Micromonospora endolithica TaxID=230091 RepID=A0A3A9ZQU5_9ACTN|nr:zinc ribbon domain-containing protein [Micromonospora endolithica]RKN50555.1 hypothetical protein D7223_01910 [Micromonospora endolithica]TWJ20731.1 hypothetical protein JD76_00830 [Micromonospora endolithica]